VDDGTQTFSDGRVGTALIQEFRFNEYIKRLQKHMIMTFDNEFKMFLKFRGFNIDSSLFDLQFNDPQNFAAYREVELNTQRITAFNAVVANEFLSKRFMMKKYLGLTEIEMEENDRMWREERGEPDVDLTSGNDLRNVGVTTGGINSDLEAMDNVEPEGEAPPAPDQGMPPAAAPGGPQMQAAPNSPGAGGGAGLASMPVGMT
jgi:hypothetical protein